MQTLCYVFLWKFGRKTIVVTNPMLRFLLHCCNIYIKLWGYKHYAPFSLEILTENIRSYKPLAWFPLSCFNIYIKLWGYKSYALFSREDSYGKHRELQTLCFVCHCIVAIFIENSEVTNPMLRFPVKNRTENFENWKPYASFSIAVLQYLHTSLTLQTLYFVFL